MHERHTIYRVETTAQWNTHPSGPVTVPVGPPGGVIDPPRRDAPVNAEVIAEVNKQNAATRSLLDHGSKFDQTLSQLSGAFQVTKQLGEQEGDFKNQDVPEDQRESAKVSIAQTLVLSQSRGERQGKNAAGSKL